MTGLEVMVHHRPNRKPDFTVVIAHRGDAMGLWLTIHSCEIELKGSGFEYNYALVTNGEEKLNPDTERVISFLKNAGRLLFHRHYPEPLSPPTARDIGAMAADGEILFFFDNHCLVEKDYFKYAMQDFREHPEMDMLHSTTMFYAGEVPCYEYKLHLESNFWGGAKPEAKQEGLYRIAVGGHGGFACRRDVWYEVGGYWDGFIGYGGEESYFDLKMAMFDKVNCIDTRVIHYHYAGNRGYARHYTEDYFKNMMMVANVIGGESWVHSVYEHFCGVSRPAGKPLYDLMCEAMRDSQNHADWLTSKKKRTLEEQLQFFKENDIAF